ARPKTIHKGERSARGKGPERGAWELPKSVKAGPPGRGNKAVPASARQMDTAYRGSAFRNAVKGGNMGRLDDKVAVVTGGASGIGEATVRRFIGEGANVAFCDRDGERGPRVAAEPEPAGAKVAFVPADVGTEAACLDFVNGAAQKFGRLDILVNNAGIRKYEKIDEASAASWKEILDVNLMSYVFCAKAAV